jgi:predicted RNA-binding Zn ribbon-like protein
MTNFTKRAEQVSAQEFDISGGNLALDFANTISRRRSEQPVEHLLSYSHLIRWANQAGIISSAEANRIIRRTENNSKQTAKALQEVIELREAVFRMFSAIAVNRRPPSHAFHVLDLAFKNLSRKSELTWASSGAEWRWADEDDNPEKILWEVVRSCLDLLMSNERERVRECEAEACAWLFMDHSKNQSRRWCDMKVCGNREKVKRFYRRNR